MMVKASWEACGHYVRNARTSDNPAGDLVAEVWLGHPNATETAKLMAAAPDLLLALVMIASCQSPGNLERKMALDAIAKATGKA